MNEYRYRPPMSPKEKVARFARIGKMFEQAGQEPVDSVLEGWVEDTAMIPVRQLWPAIKQARQEASDGWMPKPGVVIESCRLDGRWHDPESGKLRDPWWHRCWKLRAYHPCDPREPHAVPDSDYRLASGVAPEHRDEHSMNWGDPPGKAGDELAARRLRDEAMRDISAHDGHRANGLVPDDCARCMLEMHDDHGEPEPTCWRCQLGMMMGKTNARRSEMKEYKWTS